MGGEGRANCLEVMAVGTWADCLGGKGDSIWTYGLERRWVGRQRRASGIREVVAIVALVLAGTLLGRSERSHGGSGAGAYVNQPTFKSMWTKQFVGSAGL